MTITVATKRKRPSWKQGFARSAAESENPHLWSGLVAAWYPALGPTGATLHDVSGHHNHGSLTNMSPASDWVVDENGYVLDFDGVDDGVFNTNFRGVASMISSLSVWIYLRSEGEDTQGRIIGCDTPGYFAVMCGNSRGGGYLSLFALVANSYPNENKRLTTANAVELNRWHWITTTYDGIVAPRIYVDGQECAYASGNHDYTITNNPTQMKLASNNTSGAYSLDCLIGAALAYNRVLARNEIQQLYVDSMAIVRPRQRYYAVAVATSLSSASSLSSLSSQSPSSLSSLSSFSSQSPSSLSSLSSLSSQSPSSLSSLSSQSPSSLSSLSSLSSQSQDNSSSSNSSISSSSLSSKSSEGKADWPDSKVITKTGPVSSIISIPTG